MIMTYFHGPAANHRHPLSKRLAPFGLVIHVAHGERGPSPDQWLKLLEQQLTKVATPAAVDDDFWERFQ